MRHASGHNYRNSSFIVNVAMGQIPRSTERISSINYIFAGNLFRKLCTKFRPNSPSFVGDITKYILVSSVLTHYITGIFQRRAAQHSGMSVQL